MGSSIDANSSSKEWLPSKHCRVLDWKLSQPNHSNYRKLFRQASGELAISYCLQSKEIPLIDSKPGYTILFKVKCKHVAWNISPLFDTSEIQPLCGDFSELKHTNVLKIDIYLVVITNFQ